MIRRAWYWLRDLLGRRRLEQEMDEELRVHLAMREEDLQRQGVPTAEAGRRARLEFGTVPGVKQDARDALGLRLWDEVRGDLRYALRTLGRSPGYVAVALLTLTLGIGAATAIFSAANAVLFRPLPFADPDRLVHLYETNPEFNWTDADAAPANVLDWREQVAAFQDVAIYAGFRTQFPTVRDGVPVLLRGTQVSGNLFSVLGVRPALGRVPTWEETFAERAGVVVLSHALWVTHYGGDTTIIGRRLDAGTRQLEVVAVMPPGFLFPGDGTEFWVPYGWSDAAVNAVSFRRAHFVRPVARLAAGVTLEQADAELQTVVRRLQGEYPTTNRVMGAGMMPVRDFLIRAHRRPLTILLGAAGLLLLLACVNVANLTLVRTTERQAEFALRQALGAGRFRVVRQMLTESLLLGLAGGALGLGLGWVAVRLLAARTPLGVEGATDLALDLRVLAVALACAGVTGLVSGLVPLARKDSARLSEELVSGHRGAGGKPSRNRAVRSLVVVEVALALLLAMGAGLTLRSILQLRAVDPGFRTDGVVAVQFTIPAARYPDRDQVLSLYDRFAESLEARPGVDRVGVVAQLPLAGTSWSGSMKAAGWPEERVALEILHRRADAGYFAALGIPLIRGRMFDHRDAADAPQTVLVNETFARQHFPGEDPIGQRIAYDRVPDSTSIWREIIGIVGDQQQVSPAIAARAEAFENRNQDWGRSNWVVIRAGVEPSAALAAVREVLGELDPLLPIAQTRTLTEVWRDSMSRESFVFTLLFAFGAVALLLAVVGVYGVSAQAARRRTREIGIRMALGADRPAVLRLMLGQSLTLVALGLAVGWVISRSLAGVLGTMLYGVTPGDPVTLATVVSVLGGAAVLAGWIPARRATRVPPTVVLREE
jgi:putative ABC transport system permease protein